MSTVSVFNRWEYDNALTGAREALNRGDYDTAFCNYKACLAYLYEYEPDNYSEIKMIEKAIDNVRALLK